MPAASLLEQVRQCGGSLTPADRVGFIAETEDYRFCLRCTTMTGDYSYLYCYDLNQQSLEMDAQATEEGMTMGGMS